MQQNARNGDNDDALATAIVRELVNARANGLEWFSYIIMARPRFL